jgi:hypothetical protein
MKFPRRGRLPGAALFLAVLGMLTAAVSAVPAAAAPTPPPRPMTTANPNSFALSWGNDRTTQADNLRKAVNPGGKRVTVGSMLNAANRQAHTQNHKACRDAATTDNGALIGAKAVAYYCLDHADTVNTRWTPQGISGTEDAQPGAGTVNGHRAIVFSWHSGGVGAQGTGTRLSFLDRATNKYIHVLLVRPNSAGTNYSDVSTHAGGIVWYRHYIFVAGPTSGVRVFDTNDLLRLAHNPKASVDPTCTTGFHTSGPHKGKYCGRGYHYLLPEKGQWINQRAGTRYDSMSLERASGRSPVFLTSEYRENSVGRVVRWPSSRMTSFSGTIQPTTAWHQPVRDVQGAFSRGCYYFNSGGGPHHNRHLVRARTTGNKATRWQLGGRGLQDLYWLRSANQLWTLTEPPGTHNRFLYGVHRSACP